MPALHDDGIKTIFGHSGRFDWRDSCRLCVEHPTHPSFMIGKLWGYLVGAPAPAETRRALERAYVDSGFEVRPIVEAILRHPLFYEGPRLVTPPIVYIAGLLRATGETITTNDWAWVSQQAGQFLFDPPNVAGWNYADWLDTARWVGRFTAVNWVLTNHIVTGNRYSTDETPREAVAAALAFWGDPQLSKETVDNLIAFSRTVEGQIHAEWEQTTIESCARMRCGR